MSKPKRPIIIENRGCMMPLTIAFLAFLLFVAALYIFPQFKASLGLGNLPTSFDEMRADQVMGYKTTQINESILTETRIKAQLIVMEQDVQVDMEISQMLWNIPVFEKTQVIHAYGTGAFGVDLSGVTEGSIEVDHNLRQVTIRISKPLLMYIETDYTKTQYEDTEHALFAFGDIKMTQEQQTVVNQNIKDAMYDVLNTAELLKQAEDVAEEKVKELLQPLVDEVVLGYAFHVQSADDTPL